MARANPILKQPGKSDPLAYWLEQESLPLTEPDSLPGGWWILPVVAAGAVLWGLIFWALLS